MRTQATLQHLLDGVQFHWRLKDAVGQVWQAQRFAAHAHEAFDMGVPRLQILVAQGPVAAVAVPHIGRKIEIGKAVYLPVPEQRFTAQHAGTHPVKGLVGVEVIRIQAVIVEKVLRRFVKGVAQALDGVIARPGFAVGQAAPRHLPGGAEQGRVIKVVLDFAPAFEHQYLQPLLAQFLGRPTAGNARADNNCVELIARLTRHRLCLRSRQGSLRRCSAWEWVDTPCSPAPRFPTCSNPP